MRCGRYLVVALNNGKLLRFEKGGTRPTAHHVDGLVVGSPVVLSRRDLAFEASVRAHMAASSPLVRQSAVRACARMLRTSDWRPLVRVQAAHDRDAGVRSYAQALLDAPRGAPGAP